MLLGWKLASSRRVLQRCLELWGSVFAAPLLQPCLHYYVQLRVARCHQNSRGKTIVNVKDPKLNFPLQRDKLIHQVATVALLLEAGIHLCEYRGSKMQYQDLSNVRIWGVRTQ